MKRNNILESLMLVTLGLTLFSSCKDDKSYADLLNDEEHAVNWYLSGNKVVPYVPSDSVFEVGANAPYYRMDEDGFVYMQVLNAGDPNNRPKKGNTVYFRYRQKSIKDMYNGLATNWVGNGQNLTLVATSLIYGNLLLDSSASWGEGIQVPLNYLGYDSEVNLVVKSQKSLSSTMAECIPLLLNVKYFKAEY